MDDKEVRLQKIQCGPFRHLQLPRSKVGQLGDMNPCNANVVRLLRTVRADNSALDLSCKLWKKKKACDGSTKFSRSRSVSAKPRVVYYEPLRSSYRIL